MPDITHLLTEAAAGDRQAREELFRLTEADLQMLARRLMARVPADPNLEVSDLVVETFVQLFEQKFPVTVVNRSDLLAFATKVMGVMLIGNTNYRRSVIKIDQLPARPTPKNDILDISEALTQLAAFDSVGANLVKLCYIDEHSITEAAEVLQISTGSAKRRLRAATKWFSQNLWGESLVRKLTRKATPSPTALPAFAPTPDTVEVGSERWHQLNKRRAELIFKKNRGGLTEPERTEYEHLQQLCGEAIERAFPRPKLSPEQLALIQKALDSPTE